MIPEIVPFFASDEIYLFTHFLFAVSRASLFILVCLL